MSLLAAGRIAEERKKLVLLSSSPALRSPRNYIDTKRLITSGILDRIDASVLALKSSKESRYKEKAASLAALNPLAVLARGYEVNYTADGRILKSVEDVSVGDTVKGEIADGVIYSTVTKKESRRR
jgi:exodeoxyribonuclease VII large subunit